MKRVPTAREPHRPDARAGYRHGHWWLPVTAEVKQEAERRKIDLVIVPTVCAMSAAPNQQGKLAPSTKQRQRARHQVTRCRSLCETTSV
jgi:hypothetical protein